MGVVLGLVRLVGVATRTIIKHPPFIVRINYVDFGRFAGLH